MLAVTLDYKGYDNFLRVKCEHLKQAPLPKIMVPLALCQHWH